MSKQKEVLKGGATVLLSRSIASYYSNDGVCIRNSTVIIM